MIFELRPDSQAWTGSAERGTVGRETRNATALVSKELGEFKTMGQHTASQLCCQTDTWREKNDNACDPSRTHLGTQTASGPSWSPEALRLSILTYL